MRYRVNDPISVEQFRDLLIRSSLGERRPIQDRACLKGMIQNASLTVTAWDKESLVGISRSVTDFCYACYLSDLAVDRAYQRQGIGRELIRRTQLALEPGCKVILLAAPASVDYYPRIGFEHHPQCWMTPARPVVGNG